MGNKILIAYSSKGGATRQASEIITEVLRDNHNSMKGEPVVGGAQSHMLNTFCKKNLS